MYARIMEGISSLLYILAVSIGTHAIPYDTGDRRCGSSGAANGDQVDIGDVYYECRDGAFVVKGCLTEESRHVPIGDSTERISSIGQLYRVQCQRNGDSATLEPTGCIHHGDERRIYEEWDDGSVFYACTRDGRDMRVVTLGCADQGRRVRINERITKDEYLVVCNPTLNNGARLMQIGCVKDGRQYLAGESFDDGKFWYSCVSAGTEFVETRVSGCMKNGQRLNNGEIYMENDVSYECSTDSPSGGCKIVGCAQRNGGAAINRRLGCNWIEGQPPVQYEWNCKYDAAGKTAVKVQIRCNYIDANDVFLPIEPGCYRTTDQSCVGCLKQGDGLTVQTYEGENSEKDAIATGLQAC